MTERVVLCPWCQKRFPDLSARYHHSRASHTSKDLRLVEFDIRGGAQVSRWQAIGDVVERIVARVQPRG